MEIWMLHLVPNVLCPNYQNIFSKQYVSTILRKAMQKVYLKYQKNACNVIKE